MDWSLRIHLQKGNPRIIIMELILRFYSAYQQLKDLVIQRLFLLKVKQFVTKYSQLLQ